jgi:ferredoxin
MPKFVVKVDEGKCIGCGSCVAVCPENFELKENGRSRPLQEEIDDLGCSQIAAESCPVQAITVEPSNAS